MSWFRMHGKLSELSAKKPDFLSRLRNNIKRAAEEKRAIEIERWGPEGRPYGVQKIRGVSKSVEFQRILNLPRRKLDLDAVQDVTSLFHREGGTMSFWPIQSAALIEASEADGLFAPIGVGAGKTLLSLALPDALDSKRTVLLVPSQLKKKSQKEISFYGRHFCLPIDRITIIAYSELSSAKHQDILFELDPDLIIADECHALRHRSSARTKRFLRFMNQTPSCRFAGMSGTITNKSILDYAHLLELALRKNSPLPRIFTEVGEWSAALDVDIGNRQPRAPGVLVQFCKDGENVRKGYRRRLTETPGVVATEEGAIGTSLIVRRLAPDVPDVVKVLLHKVKTTWCIGEEELESAIAYWRVMRQLAAGFYYVWVWPDGIVDHEWLEARAAWHKEVREKLKQSRQGLDSPLLLANAAERYRKSKCQLEGFVFETRTDSGEGPRWRSEHWDAWRLVKDRPKPPTKAVWVSDYIIYEALIWAAKVAKKGPAIIWYEHKCIGEKLAEVSGLPHFGPGDDATDARDPIIICGTRTQGTGKNLQFYNQNLFTSLSGSGTEFEQNVGRTHRPGQLADEVLVDWYGNTEETIEALAKIIKQAEYMQDTTGQRQKVLYATLLNNNEIETKLKEK